MRHYVIASHRGFSKGIYESIKIIIGEQAGVDIITAFIDGKNDIEVLVNGTLEKFHLQMKSLYVLMSLEAASTRNL